MSSSVSPRRGGPLRRALGRALPPALVFLVVLVLWYLASEFLLSDRRQFLLPPPHEVVMTSFGDAENFEELMEALGRSAWVAFLGLLIATAVGGGLAVLMSQAPWVERSLYPYAVALQTIPILALVPLFGFWFGFGFSSRVLVCVLIALFPIIANTLFGLRSVQQAHRDLFALARVGRLTRLVKLELPSALPSFFTGLRISAGLSVIGAIVGDLFFRQGDPGMGVLMDLYRQRLQSEQLFGAVLLSSLLGIAVFWSFGFLARRVVGRWHESGRDPTRS